MRLQRRPFIIDTALHRTESQAVREYLCSVLPSAVLSWLMETCECVSAQHLHLAQIMMLLCHVLGKMIHEDACHNCEG